MLFLSVNAFSANLYCVSGSILGDDGVGVGTVIEASLTQTKEGYTYKYFVMDTPQAEVSMEHAIRANDEVNALKCRKGRTEFNRSCVNGSGEAVTFVQVMAEHSRVKPMVDPEGETLRNVVVTTYTPTDEIKLIYKNKDGSVIKQQFSLKNDCKLR